MPQQPGSLAGPENLDRALQVTTAKGWIALVTLLAMIAAVVVWSLLAEVATYVRGDGILLSRGGAVFDAAAPVGGTLMKTVFALGDRVAEGEVVAEIHDEEASERYASALALREERFETLRERRAEVARENALIEENLEKQKGNLAELERTGRDLLENAEARLRGSQELFEQGLIARTILEQGEGEVDVARRNLFDVMRRRDELDATDLRRRTEQNLRISGAEAALLDAERRVQEIETAMETWRIRAPVSGRVTEVKAQVGAVLGTGQPVLGIETGGDGFDVLVFVSPEDGKRIQPEMPARVSPATHRHVEYGYLTGAVETISEFPASLPSMIALLQNRNLAETFSGAGPPYVGRIALTADPATTSGFAWTSPKGAEVDISAGTLAAIEIEVRRQTPISLVVPLIRETLER